MSLTDMAAVTVVAGLLYATTKQTSKSKLATNPATKRVAKVYMDADLEHYRAPKQTSDVFTARDDDPGKAKPVSMKISSF